VGNTGEFTNNGDVIGTVVNSDTGTTENNGLTGDVENLDGGFFSNNGSGETGMVLNSGVLTLFENNDTAVTGDVTNQAGATFENNGSAQTGAVVNTGTGTSFLNTATATTGAVTNQNAAYFENDGGTTLAVTNDGADTEFYNQNGGTTGDLTNRNAAYFLNDTGSTTGAVTNQTGGLFDNFGGTTLAVTNDGAGTFFGNYSGGLTGAVTNSNGAAFDNAGTIGGTLGVSGGAVENAATGTVSGATTITGGTVDNFGTLADVGNAGTGTFRNQAGGTAGAVANAALGSNDGTIASLTNTAGTFDNDGTITGPLTVSGGTVSTFGTGTVGGLTTVGAGGTVNNFGTSAAVTNAGSFTNGGTAGAVTNTGTGTSSGTIASLTNSGTFATTGTIGGAVANSGALTAAGSIGGDITNAGSFVVSGDLTAAGTAFANVSAGTLNVTGGNFTGLSRLDNMSSAPFGVTVDAGRTLGVGTLTNFAGSGILNNGLIALGAATLINQEGATFTNNGVVTGPVLNSGLLISNNGSSFSGGAFANLAPGVFQANGTVGVGGPATNAGTVDLANGSTADRLSFGSTLEAGGTFLLDATLTSGAQSTDLITVAGATSGAPFLSFTTTGSGVGQDILFFDTNGGTFTVDPSQVSGLSSTGSVIASVRQDGPGQDLFLVTQANPAIGGLAANISLTQSLITTVVNRPTSPLVDLGRVEGEACRSGGFARLSGGEATVSGESNNGAGSQTASIDSSYGSIQAGWDYGCYDGRFDGWDLAFGGLVGLTNGSTSQDVFEASIVNPALLTGNIVGNIDTDFDQTSVGLYMAARRDRFLADVQLRYDDTSFDFSESTVAGANPIGLNGASASSNALTLAARVNYVYSLNTPGLSFIPNAGLSYTSTDGDTVAFTDGSGNSLQLNSYDTMIGFAGGTLARTVAGESGREATTTFLTANYYQDFGDDPTSVFYDGQGGSQTITSSNLGGFGEIGIGLNYFADVTGRMGGVQRLNAAIRADVRSGENVSDAYALTAQFRLSF
jgi:hypothetical protein